MSAETWLKRHYPIDAKKVPVELAVQHSLTKWKGLRKANLDKHGLRKFGTDVYDPQADEKVLDIGCDTCALCVRYIDDACENCPLALARGGVACDNERDSEGCSPWESWSVHSDPEPMIKWLKKARKVAL